MPQARGSQTTIAIYEESTYGADPGTPVGQKVYFTSCGVKASQSLLDSETLTGSRERSAPDQGNINVAGPLAQELSAQSIGTLLKHTMGTNATTGAGPYVHTMTLGDLPTSFVLEKDYGSNISGSGRYQRYNGCRINGAAMTFPQEGPCTVSFDIVGSKETADSSPLDASLDDNGHTTFFATAMSLEEGGASIATVKESSLNIDNALDQDGYTVGQGGIRSELSEGFATISGSLTAVFDSTTLLNKAINGTETSLKVILSRGDGLGSAGNESIEVFAQQMMYERTSPEISGPGGILVQLSFKGYISGSTSALQITLKNAVATI